MSTTSMMPTPTSSGMPPGGAPAGGIGAMLGDLPFDVPPEAATMAPEQIVNQYIWPAIEQNASALATAAAKVANATFFAEAGARKKEGLCPLPSPLEPVYTVPIMGTLNFYQINVIVSAACCVFAAFSVGILMMRHMNNITRPQEQIHILRICTFIPVYSAGVIFIIVFPNIYTWLEPWLKVAEGLAIAYFYLLMCWLAVPEHPELSVETATLKDLFLVLHTLPREKQGHSYLKKKKRFHQMYCYVLQCPPMQLAIAICMNITNATGNYCMASKSVNSAYLWLGLIQILSIVVAVVGVVRTYSPSWRELKPHKAMSKFWAFKLLIALSITQNIIYLILQSVDVLKPSLRLSVVDLQIGIPYMLLACELVFFALFFHYAYSHVPYVPEAVHHPEKGIPKRVALSKGRLLKYYVNQRELWEATLFMFTLPKFIRQADSDRERKGRSTAATSAATSQNPSPSGNAGGVLENDRTHNTAGVAA